LICTNTFDISCCSSTFPVRRRARFDIRESFGAAGIPWRDSKIDVR
jgi:hypothetical protein